jgi:hypothetical protein
MRFFVVAFFAGTMAFAQAPAAKVAPKPETKSAPAYSQWIGQKSEAVGKKMGLRIRESRDITEDGTYGLEAYGSREKITTVFFGKSIGKTADGSHIYKVLDILFLPPISKRQFFSIWGELNGKSDDQLFGIGINDKTENLFKKSEKVWRTNIQSEKIEPISTEGVKLSINTEEGYVPE